MATPATRPPADVPVTEASQADASTLCTIVPRAFHPVNPYIKKTMPDTPDMRSWWSRIFTDEINDKNAHLLAAVDPNSGTAVGILSMRRMTAQQKGAGAWSMYSLTPDHDEENYRAMIDSMGQCRERLMLGRPHMLIQLFGVDDAYKGKHIGQRLLVRACELGDAAGLDIFVQANGTAAPFYCKQGFCVEDEVVMPDGVYGESIWSGLEGDLCIGDGSSCRHLLVNETGR
ncbi:hypothetical protein LTR53_009622 [Teratosphaeriaceae sp. CCFEE 6253]|nr:hypothetical protein LTR53_009622 [Teratosphaeriaceae sp. CCFEE 6253]